MNPTVVQVLKKYDNWERRTGSQLTTVSLDIELWKAITQYPDENPQTS